MSEFLEYEDCLANVNSVVLAGRVVKVEPLTGKATGIAFTVGYEKHWPNGQVQTIPIVCYITGPERLAQLRWLQPGEWVLVHHAEVTNTGAVYVNRVEWLSRPPRESGEEDLYLSEAHSS